MSVLENKFNLDMKDIYLSCKRELGYTPTRFMQLVSQKGGVQAAKQLILKDGGTYGFEVLWENNRLDLSIEAYVLRPEYESLFSDEERRLCRNRLIEFGYKIP